MKAHHQTHMLFNLPLEWRPATPPNLNGGRPSGLLRSCSYCGSMHPEDLAAAIKAGAVLRAADRKYGWPHKFYVDGVPNPHAGVLETSASSSARSQKYSHEVREPRFDQRTGERVADYVFYTEPPQPAPATTSGKFYTEHLEDADPDDRAVIESAMGLHFQFSSDGCSVQWSALEAA